MKNERNHQYFYQMDDSHKSLGKNRYNNIKSNSPVLSHQENNYFYNTKINHLILQGLSNNNNNREHHLIQQQNPLYNSVYINYGLLDKNSNNLNNINQRNEMNNSLNKDNKNIIGLESYSSNRKNLNIYSKSFLQENSSNNYINSNYDEYYTNNRYSKNNNNPFQVLNYLKKRKNVNNNILHLPSKDLDVNYSNEIYDTNFNISRSGIFQNKNKSTFIEGVKNKKNICIYNNKNNHKFNKNAKSNKNIDIKVPLKKENIGNYYIKNPSMVNSKRDINKNNKINKINIGKKGIFKSPENLGVKNKTKYIQLKNPKNSSTNKISSIYNSEVGFYKKNELKTKSSINISNRILRKNNILNNNIKTSTINNINRYHLGNNIIYNDYNRKDNLNDNLIDSNEKKMNTQNDIYIKMNPKSYRYADINVKNSVKKGSESPKIKALSDKKIKTNNNYNNFTKGKKVDYTKINDIIEEFCEILEQFYYNSFKNCFNFFIQKMILFTQQKNSNRAIVLRRLKDGKKSNISKDLNRNNSKSNFASINNSINNKEINDPRKKEKSPTKFVELQNNLMPSMMKINQDNYIQMFNELFKRQNESFDDKRCRSPMIEKRKLEEEINLFKDSFNLENTGNKEKVFNKYKTNTNINNIYFPKKNNLKVNINSINNSNNKRINNIMIQKGGFRPSLSSDNKKNNLNRNTSSKKYINNKIENNNNIKMYNDENLENSVYYDNQIFKNQKYKIYNSSEPYYANINKDNSDKKDNENDLIKSQGSKNIVLYSKPLLKKSITKESETPNPEMSSVNIINLKQTDRNNQTRKNNINTFHSHNVLNVNQNLSTNSLTNYNQKSIFENLNYKEEIKNIFNQNIKYCEIVIKNVCTKDKRLHVFIKYVELGNIPVKKNKNNINLYFERTDSISLMSKIPSYDHKSFVFLNSLLNNENDFDNANLEKNRFYNISTERKVFECQEELTEDNSKKIFNKNILTNIDKQESKLNQHILNNNSVSSLEEKNRNNEDINNSTIYLINFLQNLFDDNKKLMLFNFFKNLKKIKTNSLLHTSMKNKEKNKLKNITVVNSQRYNNKNIIEINNFNNYKNLNTNRSIDIKLKSDKTKNLKYDLSKSLNSNITRNKDKEFSLNQILNKPHLSKEIFKSDNKTNHKMVREKNKLSKHRYNTSFNRKIMINSNSSSYLDKKDSLIEDSLKQKEQSIIIKKSVEKYEKNKVNEGKEKEKEKEKQKMKEIKLAKLGKIFKNLEQENNIISAIKEQFLEWSNNNNFDLRKTDNKNKKENEKKNKKYGIKTFDMQSMFKNDLNADNIQNIKEDNENEEFEENLNIFRQKLIVFSLKNKSQINDKIENEDKSSKNKYEDNDDENEEENKFLDDKCDNIINKEDDDIDSLNKKEYLEERKENDGEEEEED